MDRRLKYKWQHLRERNLKQKQNSYEKSPVDEKAFYSWIFNMS